MATDTTIDTSALKPVLIICDGGLVRDVLNLQPGQEYELFDADVLENSGSEAADYWDDMSEETRAVALDRYENWATEAKRLSELRKTGPNYQTRRERLEAFVNTHGGAATIGNGAAFRKGRQFAAWMGIVPGEYSTGGKQTLLGISTAILPAKALHTRRTRSPAKKHKTDLWSERVAGATPGPHPPQRRRRHGISQQTSPHGLGRASDSHIRRLSTTTELFRARSAGEQ